MPTGWWILWGTSFVSVTALDVEIFTFWKTVCNIAGGESAEAVGFILRELWIFVLHSMALHIS